MYVCMYIIYICTYKHTLYIYTHIHIHIICNMYTNVYMCVCILFHKIKVMCFIYLQCLINIVFVQYIQLYFIMYNDEILSKIVEI